MKHFFTLLLLALTGLLAFALAQDTTGGTIISNTATATFTDSNNQARSTQSNTVTTRVRTVYSFEILEDDGRAPTTNAGDASDYAGYTENDGLNDADVAAGEDVTFTYTLVNNTNNEIEVDLTLDESASDDFDLNPSVVSVVRQDNSTAATISNGRYVLEQETTYIVTVTGTVPPTQSGNDVALIDLRAENTSAVNDPVLADRATGPGISFENNNIARVTVLEEASIGVAKDTVGTLNNGDGTYTLTYRLTAENLGNVTLNDVTLTDNVSNFPGAGGYTVTAVPTASQTGPGTRVLATTGTWNGTTGNILGNNFSLNRGQSTQVDITFTFTPGTTLTYANQAAITGTSPTNVDVTDLSDNGINPDADGDGLANEQATAYDANNNGTVATNEGVVLDDGTVGNGTTADNNDPTLVTLEETPVLGVAKEATTATEAAGFPGQFETTITVRAENLGDVVLNSLNVTDDLDATFPGPATYTVTATPSVSYYDVTNDSTIATGNQSSNLTANGSFDGSAAASLATGSLATGEGALLTFTVRFDPNGITAFSNQAAATAQSPAGVSVSDLSDDGDEPDVGGDGVTNEQNTPYDANNDGVVDPADEGVVLEPTGDGIGNDTTENDNDPTPITFNETPALGVAKNLDSITQVAPGGVPTGEFDATFTMTVQNYGNVNLNSVQITDNLASQFGASVDIASITFVSATNLTQNPAFFSATGVGSSTNLLTGGDSLQPGNSGTITFTVRFDPNGATGLENSATAAAVTPGGDPTDPETSTDGTDPDADGDNDDGTTDGDGIPNEDTPTPVLIPETPLIGVANTVASVTNNGDGSYQVVYTLTVENFGNVDLKELQLSDDLFATFGGAYDEVSVAVDAGTSGFTLNPTFDGDNDTNLLDPANPNNTLDVGETKQLTVTVTVTPGTNLGPYTNSVTATGESPADAVAGAADTTDTSTNSVDGAGNPLNDPDQDPVAADGTTLDSGTGANDNDNDPTNNTSPTPVTFAETASFTIEKSDTTATYVANGQWEATFTVTVANTGDVELRNVQVQDDLDSIFTGTAAFVNATAPSVAIEKITGPGATTSTVSANRSYNGDTVINLLNSSNILAVNERAVITFTVVRFDPGSEDGPFTNTATVTGATSPGGTDVTAAVDNDDTGTISYTPAPALGLAKNATVLNADTDNDPATVGPFRIQFDFYVKNTGNVDVTNVSITDTLEPVFTVSSVSKVSGPASLSVNTSFDGRAAGDDELVAANSSLAVGATAQLRVIVTAPAGTTGSYTNTATATADGPQNTDATETSNDGTNPDAPGDVPTPINLDALELTKTARTCATADCLAGGIVNATGATVEPGQYIEYTIVAQNVGSQTLTSVVINDTVPTWSTPVAGQGEYVQGANTTAGIECSTTGSNGTYGPCPSGPADTVTDVRLNVGTLTANGTADDSRTLTFVVFIP